MLNNNHVQIFMSAVRIDNENKKTKGRKFMSEESLKLMENEIISFVNYWNKIENFLVNNKISILIKEAFYLLFGVPYPEYLFSNEDNDYVVDLQKGKTEDGKIIVEFRTTPDVKYALNVSKMWFWKKYYIKYVVNKTAKEYGRSTFRFKRILTY